jgi:Na+/H+ antiporter NhaD/arsenite permease-like protein
MNDIKSLLVWGGGALLTMLSPIKDFLLALMILFILDFTFGVIADKFNGEKWEWDKAKNFFKNVFYCCVIIVSLFVIGYFLHEAIASEYAVKTFCLVAFVIFFTKIVKNWRKCLIPGTEWYKLADFLYYLLSFSIVDRLKVYKDYQKFKEDNGKEEKK